MQENTSGEWDIPRLYHEKGLRNYFIPCHRKYSGQMGRLAVIQLNCTDRWKVRWNTDGCLFLWHGINYAMINCTLDLYRIQSRIESLESWT